MAKAASLLLLFAIAVHTDLLLADGKVMPRRDYKGSLEEKSQEAILIFQASTDSTPAIEDMILKIEVEGDAKDFAWIIPLPNEPKIRKEDPKLFQELFDYVQYRQRRTQKKSRNSTPAFDGATKESKVEVLKREIVGNFDITTVKENEEGGLNPWLESEGFQTLVDADDVLNFYREKQYVYACIKVNSEALATEQTIDSHPLRFTFETGGDDGIFFPMKLTGLQQDNFDLNLYVFHDAWINDELNEYGFNNRGMNLRHRDWDTSKCIANAGKNYSNPKQDPYLRDAVFTIPTVTKLFQKLHPGKRYYLTNIYANDLKPNDVRDWSDDLWLYPYYTDKSFVPLDARGPNHIVPEADSISPKTTASTVSKVLMISGFTLAIFLVLGAGLAFRR